ncbi:MAG: hypothetical protein D4S01_02955 [Dehalococcoidia bacterium]|nr:MAG: hypothetical protein D4S01_02955 [Dehalococcoidia bacterium]
MKELVYKYTETGYCRVYYTFMVDGKAVALYCAQEEAPGLIVFYQCSYDWEEPMHAVKFKKLLPPKSPGETDIDKAVNAWIDELTLRIKETA